MAVEARYKSALGEKLHMARDACGLSQRKAAKAVEITNASLSDIENGHNFPSEALLLKLVDCYAPPDILCAEIYEIYSEAKETPPPDISAFIKDNPCLYELLRDMQKKEITTEKVANIRSDVRKWRNKK